MTMPHPTMTDIAARANVSKNTVSLALRNDPQIPEVTRERIRAIAAELGYQKNPTVAHLMTQLRAGRSHRVRASLALLNANLDRHAFIKHPTVPAFVEGIRRRAVAQGYTLDEFWLHDPHLDGIRLNEILRARGIRGAVVAGLMNENRLPERFLPTWETFPCVVTGTRTHEPALSFACVDHHMVALRAFENALQLGYKRPALVLDEDIDHLVQGRFSAGVLIAQQQLPAGQRLKPFYHVAEARKDPTVFVHWLEKQKPDLVLTLYHAVRGWLEKLGYRIPGDIGVIQLEWRRDHADWAGVDQHNDIAGEAAVEMVLSMIHNGETGIPLFPRATLIGGSWVDGQTVRGNLAGK
jgi:DNA-binding LacI/PurR family transcriptional regulator